MWEIIYILFLLFFTLFNVHFSIFHTESLVKMSNSLWFSRIFTLQSSSWFCFIFIDCFLGVLEKKRFLREWEIYFITIGFENFQNFNFSVFPFLKFIDFKITTNSFIYSLVEQFFETHFQKNNYRVRGYTLGKNLTKFSGLYTPNLGCGGVYYTSNSRTSNYCWMSRCKNILLNIFNFCFFIQIRIFLEL